MTTSKHADHGRGGEDGPNECDCPCRNTSKQKACAKAGCGFCYTNGLLTKLFNDKGRRYKRTYKGKGGGKRNAARAKVPDITIEPVFSGDKMDPVEEVLYPYCEKPVVEMKPPKAQAEIVEVPVFTASYRWDRRIVEMVCSHGIGHPALPATDNGVHGCDGCCTALLTAFRMSEKK